MDRERGRACPDGSDPRGGAPLGDGPAPTIGVGPGHAHVSRDPPLRGRHGATRATAAAVVLLAGLVPALLAGAPHAGANPAPTTRAAVTAVHSSGPLVLLAQTPWVTPGQTFDLHLQAAVPAGGEADLGVAVAVFPCLSSVSAFDQSVTSGPTGSPISSTTAPLPVHTLAALPTGGFDLPMPVVTGAPGSGAGSTGPGFTIHLLANDAECGAFPSGVYPVRVQLVDTGNGRVLGSLVTHLVYTQASASTQRLRVAVVLPVQTTVGAATAPPTAALVRATGRRDRDAVDRRAGGGHRHDRRPLRTQLGAGHPPGQRSDRRPAREPRPPDGPHPAGRAGRRRLGARADLGSLHPGRRGGADRRGTAGRAVPADRPRQRDRGRGDRAARPRSESRTRGMDHQRRSGQCNGGRPRRPTATASWSCLRARSARPLPAVRRHNPSRSRTDGGRRSGSWPPTPIWPPGSRPIRAIPVLAAYQLSAELAQLYYEQPNGTSPRAVVAVAPTPWTDSPAFVDTLLGSLSANPMVQPVTTDQLFSLFSTAAACRNGPCRLVAPTAADRAADHRHRHPASAGQRLCRRRTGEPGARPAARRPGAGRRGRDPPACPAVGRAPQCGCRGRRPARVAQCRGGPVDHPHRQQRATCR